MKKYGIALIPGDGIGREVLPAATTVLNAVARRHGLSFEYRDYDWSCARYRRCGAMMPDNGLDQIRTFDAILLGAVGWPGVADHVSLWGLLIPIRREFGQYVNLRPISVFDGVASPLRDALPGDVGGGVDMVIVRENSEGEYSDVGGRFGGLSGQDFAVQQTVFSRTAVRRIADYAFTLAARRRGRVTSATKSNGIVHTMPFWDEIVTECAAEHPETHWRSEHIDALAAKIVLDPASFDVVVASNLFGDILSDLAAAVSGSIGMAPSANLNPTRSMPSMFEPVHGSAPDIAGLGVANPIGAIWSAAMLLEHLGHDDAAGEVMTTIRAVLASRQALTRDLGGSASTSDVTKCIVETITSRGKN